MNFFTKIIFHFKEIKVILITGKGRNYTSEAIWQVLSPHFKVQKIIEKTPNIFDILTKKVFIIETDLKSQKVFKKIANLIKFSQLPILVATHVGDTNSDSFEGEKKEAAEIYELAQIMPPYGFLILNFDDKIIKEIDDVTNIKNFTFGFGEKADFRISDVHTNTGTNFKINYKGKIIPIWQENLLGKEYIYSATATSCVGILLGLNFVEISEALKYCKPYSDKIE